MSIALEFVVHVPTHTFTSLVNEISTKQQRKMMTNYSVRPKSLCSLEHSILVSHHFYSTTTNRQKVHFGMQPFRFPFPNTSTTWTIVSYLFSWFVLVHFGLVCCVCFYFLLFSVVCYQCIENIHIAVLYTQSLGRAWVSFSRTSKKIQHVNNVSNTFTSIYTHFRSPWLSLR